jgi:hypothetical protein
MTTYLKGLFVKNAHEKAPEFVIGRIAIARTDLIKSLQDITDDWVNLDIKKSKDGDLYASINTYKKDDASKPEPKEDNSSDLPF